jgi:hypothetical protein
MKPRKDICIAGARTIGEWEACKAALAVGGPPEAWAAAFRDFFLERLRTRYFAPIEILRKPESHRKNGQNELDRDMASPKSRPRLGNLNDVGVVRLSESSISPPQRCDAIRQALRRRECLS